MNLLIKTTIIYLLKKRLPWLMFIMPMLSFAQNTYLSVPKFNPNLNDVKPYEDSLKIIGKQIEAELKTQPQTVPYDSVRIRLYDMMSQVYISPDRNNLDTAFTYADRLYLLAKKYNNKTLIIQALLRKELKFRRQHEYSESMKLCFEAMDVCDQLGASCTQRWAFEQIIGTTFLNTRDFPNAEKYMLQALASLEKYGSSLTRRAFVDKGYMHGTLAKIYQRWKKLDKAENEYHTQLSLMKQANWDMAIANASEEFGDFYNNYRDPNKAFPYYDEALKISLQNNHEENVASLYNSKAEAYLNLKDYTKALEFADKSLVYGKKNNLSMLMPFTYQVVYKANMALGNELEALRANRKYWLLRDSLDLKKRILDLNDVRRLYEIEQSKAVRDKERLSEEYRITSLQKQFELSKLKEDKLAQDITLEAVNRKLEKEQSLAIEQGLRMESNKQKSEQEKLSKQLKINDLDAKLKLEDQETKSLWAIMILISILSLSAIIYSFILKKKNRQLQAKNHEIQEALLKGQNIERKRVASELHDNVGSLLSAVRVSLLTLNSGKLPNHDQKVYTQIQQMVDDACREVRLISHNLLPEELEKHGLQKALEKMVERLNFSTPIEFILNTKGLKGNNLDRKSAFHLYSICLELINNILKHSEATDATLTFRKNGNFLEVFVRDNGKGFQYEQGISEFRGKGLYNVEERVKAMNGLLEITTEIGEGTRTHISVPINQPSYVASQT